MTQARVLIEQVLSGRSPQAVVEAIPTKRRSYVAAQARSLVRQMSDDEREGILSKETIPPSWVSWLNTEYNLTPDEMALMHRTILDVLKASSW